MSTASKPKGKAAKLARTAGKVADESMGVTRNVARASIPTLKMPEHLEGVENLKNAKSILVSRIEPDPDQPREEFEEEHIENLARSMLAIGQQQAVTVYWHKPSRKYRLVAGENRWRAAKRAGINRLDARVIEPGDGGAILAAQLSENGLRKNLTPMEEARAFQRLIEKHGWKQARISEEIGYSRSHVSRAMSLLKLPAQVRDLVEAEEISASNAYELTKVADPEAQLDLAVSVASGELVHSDLVAKVQEIRERHGEPESVPALPPVDPGPKPIPARRESVASCNGASDLDVTPEPPKSEQWKGTPPPQLARPEPRPDPVDFVVFEREFEASGETLLTFQFAQGPFEGVKMIVSLPSRFLDPRDAIKVALSAADKHLCQDARLTRQPGSRARIIDPGHEDYGKTGHIQPHSPTNPANVGLWLDRQIGSQCYFEGVEVIGGDS